ncbi:MAG TPA: hypothetical protein ENK94_02545 [Campylobacterales bacterium]|nr:hypothetical protein [Campylobacterales bacterium]
MFITFIFLLLGYYLFTQEEQHQQEKQQQPKKQNQAIKIEPIVIEPSHAKTITKESLSQQEVFNQLEQAIEKTKRATSEEKIAQDVLQALERNLNKPIKTITLTQNKTEQKDSKNQKSKEEKSKQKTLKKVKKREEKIVQRVKKPSKPEKIAQNKTVKKVKIQKAQTQNLNQQQNIVLISKNSHASLTQTNTLVENTHPDATLTIFNGSKAYVLDESAETKEISVSDEAFENLPWSKTYGVVEESENFEQSEEVK